MVVFLGQMILNLLVVSAVEFVEAEVHNQSDGEEKCRQTNHDRSEERRVGKECC